MVQTAALPITWLCMHVRPLLAGTLALVPAGQVADAADVLVEPSRWQSACTHAHTRARRTGCAAHGHDTPILYVHVIPHMPCSMAQSSNYNESMSALMPCSNTWLGTPRPCRAAASSHNARAVPHTPCVLAHHLCVARPTPNAARAHRSAGSSCAVARPHPATHLHLPVRSSPGLRASLRSDHWPTTPPAPPFPANGSGSGGGPWAVQARRRRGPPPTPQAWASLEVAVGLVQSKVLCSPR